jgi:hypothetical protein
MSKFKVFCIIFKIPYFFLYALGISTSFGPFWTVPDSFLDYNFDSVPPEPVKEPPRHTLMVRSGCWGDEITQKQA